MPKTRAQKMNIVEELAKTIQASHSMVFTHFFGLTVADVETLRKLCRKNQVRYLVAKKTLWKIACQKAGKDLDPSAFAGEVSAVCDLTDSVTPAKILVDFQKTHEAVKLIAGWFEGKMMSPESVVALSKLPSKQELLAKAVGSLQAPITGLVHVLAGNLRGLLTVLSRIHGNP